MPPRPRPTETEIAHRMAAATADHRAGRLAEAILAYRAVATAAPKAAEVHNNLGTALKAAGQLEAAIASLQRAIRIRPDYAMAHGNLASALAAAGRDERALHHWLTAFRLVPDDPAMARGLARTLRPMRFARPSPQVRRAVEKLLRSDVIDPQPIVPAAISLLKLDDHVRLLCRRSEAGPDPAFDQAMTGPEGARLIADSLLEHLLLFTLCVDEELEGLLATIRRRYLRQWASGGTLPPAASPEGAFMAAVACQSFATGYVWRVDEAEQRDLDGLLSDPASLRQDAAPIVAAMYLPLHRLPAASMPMADPGSGTALLYRRQRDEPVRERVLADRMPRLTEIADRASLAVRAQYEEDPYPRWFAVRRTNPKPLRDVARALFPRMVHDFAGTGTTRILVAGCGTGKHAVEVATRYADADVLAIDLSLASLAYGRRKSDELGLGNLRFAQADILGLGAIRERFDLVESLGVLHHMSDPEAGWRTLAGLLAPSGLMRIGLYSARARERIHRARDHVASLGLQPTTEGIREARAALRALPAEDPARAVTRELDFFSASGCRDFLFHAQETAYALPEIALMLDRLGLEFIGFETFTEAPKRLYARRFPEDTAMTDLGNWDRLERQHPALFHNMYQFWCRHRP